MNDDAIDSSTMEEDELARFVREWCAIEDGAPRAAKFVVKAGRGRNDCTKVYDPIFISGEADVEQLIRKVKRGVKTGLTTGKAKVFVEAWEGSGARHAIDYFELPGDPISVREAETELDPVGNGGALASVAQANAQITLAMIAYCREKDNKLEQAVNVAAEMAVEASALTRELAVRAELGNQSGTIEAIKALAPTLEKSVPGLFHLYVASLRGTEGDPTPIGRFRGHCLAIQREVLHLVAWANDPAVVDVLRADPNIRMEIRGRLGQMANEAMVAFNRIVQEPPPAEQAQPEDAPPGEGESEAA